MQANYIYLLYNYHKYCRFYPVWSGPQLKRIRLPGSNYYINNPIVFRFDGDNTRGGTIGRRGLWKYYGLSERSCFNRSREGRSKSGKLLKLLSQSCPVILKWVCILSRCLFTVTTHAFIEDWRFPWNQRDLTRHLNHVQILLYIHVHRSIFFQYLHYKALQRFKNIAG